MIVFFESGRLGNQLFQYAALKELYPTHRLIFFGFGELKRTLVSVDAIIIEREKLTWWLLFSLKQLFALLAKLRIVGTIQEFHENSSYVVKKTGGAILGLYLLKPSYFQHHKMLDCIRPHFEIHDSHYCKASDWLEDKIVKSNDENLVFFHIRRGDYLNWPSCEYPAVLDKQWYTRAMDYMREKVKNPIFLLLTDDPYYAKDCFGDQPDILISENDHLFDLALMSRCKHGILSASSFAWWGAWLSKDRSHEPGTYIAPKYWAGYRNAEWQPEGFITNWITYIE